MFQGHFFANDHNKILWCDIAKKIIGTISKSKTLCCYLKSISNQNKALQKTTVIKFHPNFTIFVVQSSKKFNLWIFIACFFLYLKLLLLLGVVIFWTSKSKSTKIRQKHASREIKNSARIPSSNEPKSQEAELHFLCIC